MQYPGRILTAIAFACCTGLSIPVTTRADTFNDIVAQSAASVAASQAAQTELDHVANGTRSLLREYKSTTRQIDNLYSYNTRLEEQIAQQQQRLLAIDKSIGEITGFQRDLLPLTVRMLDALEQFIALDLPFRLEERRQRIAALRTGLDDPEQPTAEKYHRVIEAFQREIGYGSGIDTYRDHITLEGGEREVTVLRFGHIALLFQTTDQTLSGRWNEVSAAWEELDDDYAEAIRDGISVAQGQVPIDLLKLPLPAPQARP